MNWNPIRTNLVYLLYFPISWIVSMQQHCYMLASQYLILDQIWTHTGWYLEQHGWTAICKYLLIAPCACKNQQIKYQILVSFVYQFLQSEHYQLLLYSPSSTLFALVLPLNITNLATIPPKLWQQGRDQGFSMRLSYLEKGKIQLVTTFWPSTDQLALM